MNALSKIEPIPLPDLPRGRMPSLPAWAARSRAALGTNLQIVQGMFLEVRTLPKAVMPTEVQREAIETHLRSLRSFLDQTAERSEDYALRTAKAATGLVMALAGSGKASEMTSEAKGDAYVAALDDVPCWAVEAAARAWYRGECGLDEKGKPRDYKWAPEPALLRNLAMARVWMVHARINELQELLDAREYVDCSAELDDGKLALGGLGAALHAGDAAGLTFQQAIERGKAAKDAPFQPLPPMHKDGAQPPVEKAAE